LEQYFVVLKESGPLLPQDHPTQGPNSFPLGTRGSFGGLGIGRPRRGRDAALSGARGRLQRGYIACPMIGRGRCQQGRLDLRKCPNDDDTALLSTPSKRSAHNPHSSQTVANAVPEVESAGDHDQTLMFVDADSSLE